MDNKDKILQLLLDNPTNRFDQRQIILNIQDLNLNEDQVKSLVKQIYNYNEDLISYSKSSINQINIGYTGLIEPFLKNGGFTQLQKDKENEARKSQYKEDLEFRKLKADFETTKIKLKDYETTKTISWIGGFLAAILSILKLLELAGLLN